MFTISSTTGIQLISLSNFPVHHPYPFLALYPLGVFYMYNLLLHNSLLLKLMHRDYKLLRASESWIINFYATVQKKSTIVHLSEIANGVGIIIIPMHLGSSADHVPFSWHITLTAPINSKLSLQA